MNTNRDYVYNMSPLIAIAARGGLVRVLRLQSNIKMRGRVGLPTEMLLKHLNSMEKMEKKENRRAFERGKLRNLEMGYFATPIPVMMHK